MNEPKTPKNYDPTDFNEKQGLACDDIYKSNHEPSSKLSESAFTLFTPQNKALIKSQNLAYNIDEAVRDEAAKLKNEETAIKISQGIISSD